MWPRYPFHNDARDFQDGSGGETAGIPEPGSVIERHAYDRDDPEDYYVPTENDRELLQSIFGSTVPDWDRVQSKLVVSGQSVSGLPMLSVQAILALLEQILNSDPSAVGQAQEFNEQGEKRAQLSDTISRRAKGLFDAWRPLSDFGREQFHNETDLDPHHDDFGGNPAPPEYWLRKAQHVETVAKFISNDDEWLQIFNSVPTTDEWMDSATMIIRRSIAGDHEKVAEWLRKCPTSGQISDTPGNKLNVCLLRKLPDLMLQLDSKRLTNDHCANMDEQTHETATRNSIRDRAPRALIMKGGGIKGLAYVGAIEYLQERYNFNWFIGTSAGAVAAVLLAAGYSIDELKEILETKNFGDFFDAPRYKKIPNLLMHQGIHQAQTLTDWIDTLLAEKLNHPTRVQLSDLPHRVTIYSSTREKEALCFDPEDNDVAAAYAVRCSMSIPYWFIPEREQGFNAYDGGIQNNYPVKKLLDDKPGTQFISLFLGSEVYEPVKQGFVIFDLLHIATEASDREIVQKYRDKTVVIDPRPIRTLDFTLSKSEKEFLIIAGRAAALAHLEPNGIEHQRLTNVRDELKAKVESVRTKRRRLRITIGIAAILLLIAVILIGPPAVRWLVGSGTKLEGTGEVESLLNSLHDVALEPTGFIEQRVNTRVSFHARIKSTHKDVASPHYEIDVDERSLISEFVSKPESDAADRETVAEMQRMLKSKPSAMELTSWRFSHWIIYPENFEELVPGKVYEFDATVQAITQNNFGTYPTWIVEFGDSVRVGSEQR